MLILNVVFASLLGLFILFSLVRYSKYGKVLSKYRFVRYCSPLGFIRMAILVVALSRLYSKGVEKIFNILVKSVNNVGNYDILTLSYYE